LAEARKRLPPLHDLNQAAALLNIPGLDDAERDMGAPLHLAAGDAACQDRRLGRQAAQEIGHLDLGQITERYVYLIENIDEHQSTRRLPARPLRAASEGHQDFTGHCGDPHSPPGTPAHLRQRRHGVSPAGVELITRRTLQAGGDMSFA
jgi:hypothetical protein